MGPLQGSWQGHDLQLLCQLIGWISRAITTITWRLNLPCTSWDKLFHYFGIIHPALDPYVPPRYQLTNLDLHCGLKHLSLMYKTLCILWGNYIVTGSWTILLFVERKQTKLNQYPGSRKKQVHLLSGLIWVIRVRSKLISWSWDRVSSRAWKPWMTLTLIWWPREPGFYSVWRKWSCKSYKLCPRNLTSAIGESFF